jgi:hypothetical protein
MHFTRRELVSVYGAHACVYKEMWIYFHFMVILSPLLLKDAHEGARERPIDIPNRLAGSGIYGNCSWLMMEQRTNLKAMYANDVDLSQYT